MRLLAARGSNNMVVALASTILRISESALASIGSLGRQTQGRRRTGSAVQDAAASGFSYIEVGGWAIAEKVRCTAECLRSVLAVYAWSRLVGGALGVSTATERNGSASILKRLGGSSMQWDKSEIPAYYDPRYDCRMHMLRYDSRTPTARYEASIRGIEGVMANVPVISPDRPVWQSVFSWVCRIRGISAPSIRVRCGQRPKRLRLLGKRYIVRGCSGIGSFGQQ